MCFNFCNFFKGLFQGISTWPECYLTLALRLQHSFLDWVNFCLTNVYSAPASIQSWFFCQRVGCQEKGRYATLHISLKCCSAQHNHTYVRNAKGRKFSSLLGGMVHFKETQTGSFVFLSRILAPDTNLPAFFPQSSSQLFGPEMYPWSYKKYRKFHRGDSSS